MGGPPVQGGQWPCHGSEPLTVFHNGPQSQHPIATPNHRTIRTSYSNGPLATPNHRIAEEELSARLPSEQSDGLRRGPLQAHCGGHAGLRAGEHPGAWASMVGVQGSMVGAGC